MSETMQTLKLADTGRETTRLGYGGSSLMGALGRRDSVELLEAAYDAGIRHFDVAPMYGYGAAEGCVGEFLARHPGDVTVTTKYGVPAAKNQSLLGLGRRIAGPIVRRIPAMKRRLARVATAVSAPAEKASFTAEQARISLERSLKELQTERVDVWLLHEVEASDLRDESLLRFLEDSVANGKIGTFGVGSDSYKVEELLHLRPKYCRVVQYEWSVLDAEIPEGGAFRIHHRALTDNFRSLHGALKRDAELCRRWSALVGVDLTHLESLANLMLKAAFVFNPHSVILVSSKNPMHIEANVRVASDESLTGPARRLHGLLQLEGVPSGRSIEVTA
jgi:D-threo-aldose 1-dehydrogenase